MTIDEVINQLQEIKKDIPGSSQVVVNCPMENIDCWLHKDQIKIEAAPNEAPFVRIKGGIGA